MSDNNYWEKRAVDLEKLTQDRADVDIMHVNKLFDGAVDIVEKQIEEIFGKYARDSGISQDAALRLLNEKQTETMRRNLMITLAQCQEEVARQAILARLNAPAYAARISRLEALKDLIHAQAYKVGSAAHYRLTDRLIDTYEQSYYRSIYDQQRRTETGFDFTKLADRDVQVAITTNWAGSNYSNRIWKNTKKLAESLEEVVTQGLMTGQSIRDMELALEARVVSERYKINRIIRTEVNHCCNQGTLMSYKAAGTRRYIFLATLDMRTSSICRSLDKDVFFVSKAEVGVNFPPMHPNCRSTTMAYPEDGIFPKERTARDPETNKNIHVPFDMSYAQWYRKYVIEKDDEKKNVLIDIDNQPERNTEHGDIYDLRIGDNIVDLKTIKGPTYSKKFQQLTQNTNVNMALRKYAMAMLTHRNGTDGEDLYVISSKTGKLLLSKTTGTNELGIELSKNEIDSLKLYAKKEGIIGIHNHPTNLLPTGSDFVAAGARGYDFGMVATHNGRVFVYKVGDIPFRSEHFNHTVDKYHSEPYNYDIEVAQKKTLLEFEKEFGISWMEL